MDAPTADTLNQILKNLGALDTAVDNQKRMVAGQVMQDDGTPFRGTVILFDEGEQESLRLGEDTAPEGRYTIGYDSSLSTDGAKLRRARPDNSSR